MTATTAGPGTPVRPPHPLTGEAVRLVSRVRAAAEQDEDAATVTALADELARTRAGAASVVVVGEKNRGKSSLVNGLVGHPGLLPVDADIASCVHVVVGHGDPGGARVEDARSPDGREIGLDEVGAHAGLDPDTQLPVHEGVTRVAVRVPAPVLAGGLELVDTPGVGGLVAGHAALTLAALEQADALLFVLDAHSEISAPELSFLERASGRIATIGFVLTKIDAVPGWRAVLARDIALVSAHAPRYDGAPWFPVSVAVREAAERAEAAGRAELAARRRAEDGMDGLAEYLERVARGAEGLRLANLVHQAGAGAERAVRRQRRGLHALALAPEFLERVTAEKAALNRLQGRQAAWRQTLSERIGRLEKDLRTELARHVEDMRKETGDRIAAGGAEVFDAVTADLPARVRAVWVELENAARRGLPEVARAVAAELAVDEVDLDDVVVSAPARLLALPEATRGRTGTTLAEHGATAMGLGSMTFSLASVALGAAVGSVVGLVAGAAIVGVFAYRRNQKEKASRSREDARRFVADVCARLTTEVPPALANALLGAKETMSDRMTAILAEESARVRASLDEHERALTEEKGALARRKAAAQKRIGELEATRAAVAALGERLDVRGGGT